MTTLLSFSLLSISIAMTLFFGVFIWLMYQAKKEKNAQNRGMFGFNDGRRDRWVDPISVMMAFENHPEYVSNIHPKLVSSGNKEATRIVLDAIKKAFDVVEYSEPSKPGLTINEMLELWVNFYTWVDTQKKNSRYDQIYAESTEQILREYERKTTNSTSVSGSTETEGLPSSP